MFRVGEIHFIDTSVFLSIILHDTNERRARQYITRVQSGVFEGYVSPLVVGEIALGIRERIRTDNFGAFFDAIKLSVELLENIRLHTPALKEYIAILHKIEELENRVSSTDVRIIAEAVTSSASKLVTFDTGYNTRSVDGAIDVVNLEEVAL